jgi:hypothetical protein
MVFNATFNNISAISWRSVLLVEEIGGPEENHRPVASHWQTFSIVIKNDRILNFMHFRHTVLVVMCIILFYLIRVNGLKHHRKMGLWRAFLVFLIRSEFKYILLYWQQHCSPCYMWGLVFYLEQELHTFPEHLRSPPVFSGVRVTRSLVLYVCLVDHCLSFWSVYLRYQRGNQNPYI